MGKICDRLGCPQKIRKNFKNFFSGRGHPTLDTDPGEATNFTTPAKLMSDSTFLTDLEAELLEGIKSGENGFKLGWPKSFYRIFF